MKDRLFWIPTLIILATPIVVAIVCMVLEVRWQTWIALASGMEPATPDTNDRSRVIGSHAGSGRPRASRQGSDRLDLAGRHRGLQMCCGPERFRS